MLETENNLPPADADISEFENMTLAELVSVFGTDEKFKTWMQGRESILNIKAKERAIEIGSGDSLKSNKEKKRRVERYEMTEEQKKTFGKMTALQQEVALNSIAGMNKTDSYKNSRGKAKTIAAIEAGACEILGNPKVAGFVSSMKASIVSDSIMSREEMMKALTPICRADVDGCRDVSLSSLTRLRGGFDVKLKSMKLLAELAGYEAPKETNNHHVHDTKKIEW